MAMTDEKTYFLKENEVGNSKLLTPTQKRVIPWLLRKFAPRDGYERKELEIKVWEWKSTLDDKVFKSVTVRHTTGLVGDEGTYAQIFARDTHWWKIGKRGKIQAWDSENGEWVNNYFTTYKH
jgi:hypothetical protein